MRPSMKLIRITATIASFVLAASPLMAQSMSTFQAKPGSTVKIDGSGNVHDWTVTGHIIGGTLELDSNFVSDPTKAAVGTKIPAKVDATIPTRSIKSGKSSMDDVMHDAMHAKDFPKIFYHLKELTLTATPKSAEGPFQFDSVGELAVSGKTNQIKMPVRMERVDKSTFRTSGNTTLKMTSFGIQPPAPKLALGLIHTDDDVKITFEWLTGTAQQ
jgi:polyisoprenoid-binding protein YceI